MKPFPVVCIEFLDHSCGAATESAPCVCRVFGILWKEDKNAYYVVGWTADDTLANQNNETYCILKSTVTDMYTLTRDKTYRRTK